MKVREIALWTIAVVLAIVIWDVASSRFGDNARTVTFSEFMQAVNSGRVRTVVMSGNELRVTGKDDSRFRTYAPPGDANLVGRLMDKGVQIDVKPGGSGAQSPMPFMSAWGLVWTAVPVFTLVLVVITLREIHVLKAKIDRLLGGGEPPDES